MFRVDPQAVENGGIPYDNHLSAPLLPRDLVQAHWSNGRSAAAEFAALDYAENWQVTNRITPARAFRCIDLGGIANTGSGRLHPGLERLQRGPVEIASIDTTMAYLRLIPGHLREDYDKAMLELAEEMEG